MVITMILIMSFIKEYKIINYMIMIIIIIIMTTIINAAIITIATTSKDLLYHINFHMYKMSQTFSNLS